MSAGMHSFSRLPSDQEVLGELLHSLSQPLTSLRCSLELSIDEAPDQYPRTVAAALEQTQAAVEMVQLMREYLDAEHGGVFAAAVELLPVLRNICDDLVSIAETRGIQVRLMGTCSTTVGIDESRLRRALQYLIMAVIEQQESGCAITVSLGEVPSGTLLRVQGSRSVQSQSSNGTERNSRSHPPRASLNMRWARRATAVRMLESVGLAVTFDDEGPGFSLQIPVANLPVV